MHAPETTALHEQLFLLQPLVKIGDVFALAVVDLRRQAFGRLASARMRHRRIDVGAEDVFGRAALFPEGLGRLSEKVTSPRRAASLFSPPHTGIKQTASDGAVAGRRRVYRPNSKLILILWCS